MSRRERAYVARRRSKAWEPSRSDLRMHVVAERPWWERVEVEERASAPLPAPVPVMDTAPERESATQSERHDPRGVVVAALADAPEGMSFSALQVRTGIPRHRLDTIVDNLVRDRSADRVVIVRARTPR